MDSYEGNGWMNVIRWSSGFGETDHAGLFSETSSAKVHVILSHDSSVVAT